jgi:hypothetical protein
MGNWLIFQCLEVSSLSTSLLPDRANRIVVLSKFSSIGECRNDEIQYER